MKTLIERLNENNINEAREIEYFVQFIAGGNMVDARVIIDKNDKKVFEAYLEEEQDNTISHADGGNIEF